MLIRLLVFTVTLLLASSVSVPAMQAVPKNLYPALEYALTIPAGREKLDPEKLSVLVNFVRSAASGSSMTMENRNKVLPTELSRHNHQIIRSFLQLKEPLSDCLILAY